MLKKYEKMDDMQKIRSFVAICEKR